jgi:hypothetical protein
MPLSRRQVLATTAVATMGIAVGGCDRQPGRGRVGPSSPAVQATEARRRRAGAPVRQVALTAAPVTLELAGRPVTTWAYNGSVSGPLVRVRAGEVLRARLDNRLPEATQAPVQPGGHFTDEFTVPLRAPTSSTCTWGCSLTVDCMRPWWSRIPTSLAAMTARRWWCWTTGPTGSAPPQRRSWPRCSVPAACAWTT